MLFVAVREALSDGAGPALDALGKEIVADAARGKRRWGTTLHCPLDFFPQIDHREIVLR